MQERAQSGTHQNLARTCAVLDALAKASEGLRLTDVVHVTGFGKGTVHRLLSGLAAHGLAEQDVKTGRFFVGMRVFSWAASAGDRFGLTRLSEPAMSRLVQSLDDTVYLSLRSGDETYCLERREGRFPIRTLTLGVGDRRPLGLTAGGLAILALLPEPEKDRILTMQAQKKMVRPFNERTLREMIARTRSAGFAYYDAPVHYGAEIISGMAAIAVPIRRADGEPIAALSVAAIADRLQPPRCALIVRQLEAEARLIEAALPSGRGSDTTVVRTATTAERPPAAGKGRRAARG